MRLTLALLLALTPATAQAAERDCLTPSEVSAVAIYTLPAMLRGAAQRCAPALPGSSFLKTNGASLSQRYARNRDKQWPIAKRAIIKAGSTLNPAAGPSLRQLPEATLKPMVDELVIAAVDQHLDPNRCQTVDRLVMLLSPMPTALAAATIALTTGLIARSGQRRIGQLRTCAA